MARVLAAIVLVLAFASPARADFWDFSWLSSTTIGGENVLDGTGVFAPSNVNGQSAAAITPLADGVLDLSFDTPAGPASIQIFQEPPGMVLGNAPVFVPDVGPDVIITSSPGPPGWSLHAVGASGVYAWTGDRAHPDSFTIATGANGSGPDSGLSLFGTGILVSEEPPPVAASEPEIALLLVSLGLVALRGARRRRE